MPTLRAQNVDDIELESNNATGFTRSIRAVFEGFCEAELKLATEEAHFGVRKIEFLVGPFHRKEFFGLKIFIVAQLKMPIDMKQAGLYRL